jgi:WXG100 family type VII secretion target
LSPTAVTAAAINAAAQEADDAAADIRKEGTTLVGNMHAQAASFTGAAGTAFRNALTAFMDDMNVILNQLETMAANTRTAATQTFDQDEQSAAALNRVSATGVTSGLT